MTPILWRLVILLTIFIAGFDGGVAASRLHYRPIIADMKEKAAEERQATAEATLNDIQTNQKRINELEVSYEKANTDLEYLRVHPAGRVLIPRCVSTSPSNPPVATGSSAVPITTTERTTDRDQQLLDDATERLKSKGAEWSHALNACANVMEWAKAQRAAP